MKRKFGELQSQITPYEQLFGLLTTKSEEECIEIVRRIKRGATVESILRYIHDGDLLLQLSLSPETRRRYELPFSKNMPSSLLRLNNPYLNSLVYEWVAGGTGSLQTGGTFADRFSTRSMVGHSDFQSAYLKPYHAAEMVEHRLEAVQPSNWTSVSTDNRLMRKLLQLYFQNEHQWFFILHKELFLDDMASKRIRFCSRLLVNAILAYACVRLSTNKLGIVITLYSIVIQVYLIGLNTGTHKTSGINFSPKQKDSGT